ncbi:hypothetical protein [Flexithrix dorotheae]|uniref:hypothetical protein n=1 Tax=Flexithrix dorotheae TaxID=70993 RepID=UPI000379D96C|nr:hypothetical protein [Flexithrix dorotheae]
MVKRTLLYFLSFILVFSCSKKEESKKISGHSTDTVEKVNRSTELIPEPDIIERLKYQKTEIDSLISKKELSLEVYAKIIGEEKTVLVKNEDWPENMETTFNIWKDRDGEILFIGEYPISESGDWFIGYHHYFDESGKTFAFERITSFFNSSCTERAANEIITDFYNKDFNRIDRIYLLKDENGQNLKKEECVFNYDYPYEVLGTLNKYLIKTQILSK